MMAAGLVGRSAALCVGDCGGDGDVTVDELILGVNVALGSAQLAQCAGLDSSGDGEVTVDELIRAVSNALTGCPAGSFAGDYSASVSFDATHAGTINLSADGSGQVSGSLLVTSPRAARLQPYLSFTFPVGGVSVALSGTYDPASGGFEVEGSFVGANGQMTPVVLSGNLPASAASLPVNVYIGTDLFTTTLSAGMLATPTPTPGPTPPPGNGPRIVYAGGVLEPHLFVINVDGSGKTQVSTSVGVDSSPAWSPDGSRIAFATPDAENRHGTIGIVNADGSNQHRIGEADAFLDGNPAWSPDGSQIVFTAGGGDAIDLMGADGSGRHRLVTKSAGESYRHLSWSPDGTRIAVETTRPRQSGSTSRLEIWVMNADGSNFVRLTNNDVPDRHPDWSADGLKIAFGRENILAGGIFTIKPDGSGETRLISDSFATEGTPNWSLDGRQLAYPTLFGIKIADADGKNPITVPNTQFISDFDLK